MFFFFFLGGDMCADSNGNLVSMLHYEVFRNRCRNTISIDVRYIHGARSEELSIRNLKIFITETCSAERTNAPKQDEPSILRWPRRTARNALHYLEIYLGEEVPVGSAFLENFYKKFFHSLGDLGVLFVFRFCKQMGSTHVSSDFFGRGTSL